MPKADDADLLARAQRADEAAFSQLFARYQRPLYLYGSRMCGAGDDIVQDTFLTVLHGTGGFDPKRGSVAGYLFGIARHFILKQLGSRYDAGLADRLEDRSGAAVAPETVLDTLTRAETVHAVRAAVEQLPPVFREVVVLCDLQEMDYATAAEVLQCPIGTVRSRLHRARSLLMTALAPERPVARVRGA